MSPETRALIFRLATHTVTSPQITPDEFKELTDIDRPTEWFWTELQDAIQHQTRKPCSSSAVSPTAMVNGFRSTKMYNARHPPTPESLALRSRTRALSSSSTAPPQS